MEDRIQINGVWYVKADSYADNPIPTIAVSLFDESEVTQTKSCLFETEDFIYEAAILLDGDGELRHRCIYINFTDKRPEPWKEDIWDNPTWLNSIIVKHPDSIKELEELKMSPSAIATFRDFLIYLRDEKEWL